MLIFFLWFAFLYFTVVNVQLPLIMLGHSYRAFTKSLALRTQKEGEWAEHEVYWCYRVTEGKEQGQGHGQTNYCTGCEEAVFLGKYIPHAASAQQTNKQSVLCMCLYIIYSIYLYMYRIIFIYVLFKWRKTAHAVPHFTIQVCRSTCFVICKHNLLYMCRGKKKSSLSRTY